MKIKCELDEETSNRLIELAVHELRPVNLQAEILLMRALGTYSPHQGYEAVSSPDAHDLPNKDPQP